MLLFSCFVRCTSIKFHGTVGPVNAQKDFFARKQSYCFTAS